MIALKNMKTVVFRLVLGVLLPLVLLGGGGVSAFPDIASRKVEMIPDSTSVAAFSPIPLPVSGSCTAGTTYTITGMQDLYSRINELECILAAGKSPEPKQVPLGFSYGYILAAANTGFWNMFAEVAYQGDYVVRTQCKGKVHNIGWMSIAGLDIGTAVWEVGQFPPQIRLADGEYPMGQEGGIIMDFTVDFKKLCPPEGNESAMKLTGFSPFHNSIWPVNLFVDFARVVGRDVSDNGIITLNKAFVVDNTLGSRTVLFYATKNFDPQVLPNFAKEEPETIVVPRGPKGEKVIAYNRKGVEGLLMSLDPTQMIKNPQILARLIANREAGPFPLPFP